MILLFSLLLKFCYLNNPCFKWLWNIICKGKTKSEEEDVDYDYDYQPEIKENSEFIKENYKDHSNTDFGNIKIRSEEKEIMYGIKEKEEIKYGLGKKENQFKKEEININKNKKDEISERFSTKSKNPKFSFSSNSINNFSFKKHKSNITFGRIRNKKNKNTFVEIEENDEDKNEKTPLFQNKKSKDEEDIDKKINDLYEKGK